MISRRLVLACSLATALQAPPSAQVTELESGDPLAGLGNVVGLAPLAVLADGSWLAYVDSDFADGTQDEALVRKGLVELREGALLAFPLAGATVGGFESIALLADGSRAAVLTVELASGLDLTALYHDDDLLFFEDEPIDSPLLGAGSVLDALEFVVGAGERTLLVRGRVRNPSVVGPVEDVLLRVHLTDDGTPASREVLLTKGQFVPVLAATVSTLTRFPRGFAANPRGSYLAYVGTTSAAGFSEALLLDGTTVLAQRGAPAPVAGRSYLGFTNSVMSLNDLGQHAFTARLDGGSFLVVRDGAKLALEGEVIAGFSPNPLRAGSTDPVVIADSGDVFWRAGSSSFADDAFLRNLVPILQEGVTSVEGRLVVQVESARDSFAVSPSGRFFLGHVRLDPAASAALVLADFGAVVPVPGCGANPARLTKVAGDARAGLTLELGLDGGPAAGALPTLVFSTRAALDPAGCGLAFPFGEVLLSRAHVFDRVPLAPWDGVNASRMTFAIPADPALVDLQLFVQGNFHLPGGPTTLSNALRLEIGAP